MVSPLAAAKAYLTIQNGGLAGPKGPVASEGPDFGELVQNAIKDVAQSSRQAEAKMVAQTQGKADLVDVVTAVASAQASLETMLSIRDQAISAYKEILQMPI